MTDTGHSRPTVSYRIPVRNFLSNTCGNEKEILKVGDKNNFSLCTGPSDCGPQLNLPQTIDPKGSPLREESSPTADSFRKSPVLIPGDPIFTGVGQKTPGNVEFWSMQQETPNIINILNISDYSRNSSPGTGQDFPPKGTEKQNPGDKTTYSEGPTNTISTILLI